MNSSFKEFSTFDKEEFNKAYFDVDLFRESYMNLSFPKFSLERVLKDFTQKNNINPGKFEVVKAYFDVKNRL